MDNMYPRDILDRYQEIVSAAYGGPVNPSQTANGAITLHNPLDNKIIASVPANAGAPDVSKVLWVEGVDYDLTRLPDEFKGWNAFGNKTTTEHRESPAEEHRESPKEKTDTPQEFPAEELAEQGFAGRGEVPSQEPADEPVKIPVKSKEKK